MKTISLLHTVPGVLAGFEDLLRAGLPDDEGLQVHNTLDTFLATDAALHGFTQNNLNRLALILKSLEQTKPDVIVVTCSTLTPGVALLRPFIQAPVVAVDDAMAAKAVEQGGKITILATAQSTVEPTRDKLVAEAARAGQAVTLDTLVCGEAFDAMRRGDKTMHDTLLKAAARTISGRDVVVLAQASMAHLESDIHAICGCRVLSSPSLCIAQVRAVLFGR
jgi:Asp/Glu/hydantoin racemase